MVDISRRALARQGLALPLAAMLGACKEVLPSSIRIGAALPLTGGWAARAQGVLDGARFAAHQLNAADRVIEERPLRFEILVQDDGDDPATAARVARELVDAKVAGVIGHLGIDTNEAAIPIYRDGGVPQMFAASATHLAALGGHNALRLVASDRAIAQAIDLLIRNELRAGSFAVIHEDTRSGRAMGQEVVDTLLRSRVRQVVLPPLPARGDDFWWQLMRLQLDPADVLVVLLGDDRLIRFTKQLAAAGLRSTPIVGIDEAMTDKLARSFLPARQLLMASAWSDRAGGDFALAFRKVFEEAPGSGASLGFAAVHLLADALREAHSLRADRLARAVKLGARVPFVGDVSFMGAERADSAVTFFRVESGRWVARPAPGAG